MATTVRKKFSAQAYSTDAERWSAVVCRDLAAEGQFFYSVRTTGVYCRPTCGARRPRRENVQFHATARDAERAGFRPCKRCRPHVPLDASNHARLIVAACRTIEEQHAAPSLAQLARTAGLSPFHFHRIFKSFTGLTPKAYADASRAARARNELAGSRRGRKTMTRTALAAGFGSTSSFYSQSVRTLGMKPSSALAGGAGRTIRFAVGQCSLGAILVAATEHGVCSISLGDDPAALVGDLQNRFHEAKLIGADRDFEQLMAQVVGLVDSPATGAKLPLDVQGTAFQHRVWQALTKIPPGQRTTYAELARRIGAPTAVRAVAAACAANPVAVAIPCHRVVRTGGHLAGYRWGIERKRTLLEREAASLGPTSDEKMG